MKLRGAHPFAFFEKLGDLSSFENGSKLEKQTLSANSWLTIKNDYFGTRILSHNESLEMVKKLAEMNHFGSG